MPTPNTHGGKDIDAINAAAVAASISNSKTGTATVTVASKLCAPFKMQTWHGEKVPEQVLGGGVRDVLKYRPTGQEHTIHGTAVPQDETPRSRRAGGFALTFGVPKALYDLWAEQHATTDMVRNGLIFAFEITDMVVDRAKEHRDLKSGIERIDPKNPPQEFKGVKPFSEGDISADDI